MRRVSCRAVASSAVMLEVRGLEAKIVSTGQQILNGVNLTIREVGQQQPNLHGKVLMVLTSPSHQHPCDHPSTQGEVHAIMGKNGSGKSTLSKVLVGHPDYEVTSGTAIFKGKDLFALEPEERSHAGLFLSFQSPIEIPGVSNVDFLRMACNARRKQQGKTELDPLEFYAHVMPKLELLNMDPTFLNRNVNEGFSGGEKKRNEILQLAVLEADMAILDEIDSGLDIDALRDVSKAVNALKRKDSGVLMVTHYKRLLDYIKPDFVHIMQAGEIIKTGDMSLVDQLESLGYASLDSLPIAV